MTEGPSLGGWQCTLWTSNGNNKRSLQELQHRLLLSVRVNWPLPKGAGSWVRINATKRLGSFGGTGFERGQEKNAASVKLQRTWLYKQPQLHWCGDFACPFTCPVPPNAPKCLRGTDSDQVSHCLFLVMTYTTCFEHRPIRYDTIRYDRNLELQTIPDTHYFNPFTPESDQCQNSPAASQEIWHHTVWRTWLFIAYSDEKWLYYKFSLHHSYNCFLKGWENTLFELRSERVNPTLSLPLPTRYPQQ